MKLFACPAGRGGVNRGAALLGVALVLCLLAAAAWAQPAVDAGQGGDLDERIASLQDRINAAKSREDIDSGVRDRAVEIYQQAISLLETAQADRRRTESLRELAQQAPAQIRQLNTQVQSLQEAPTQQDLASLDTAELSARADEIGTRLADTQSQLADLRDKLTRLAQRPDAARQELSDARSALQALATSVDADAEQASAITDARRAQLSARRQSLTAQIERLQQELSSLDARQRLLEAQRSLAEAKLERDTNALAAVQMALGEQQQNTAQTLRENSERKLSELRAAVAPISDAAQQNVDMARQLTEVTSRSEALAARQVDQRNRVDDIQRRLNLVQRQLEIGGGSVALGDVLRTQQRELSNRDKGGLLSKTNAPDIAAAELKRFQLQQSLMELDDPKKRARALMAAVNLDPTSGQMSSLVDLLEQRREILLQLVDAEGRYIDIGRDLQSLSEQYDDTLSSFNRLLDERLFWLPSFKPIDLEWPGQVVAALPWAVNPLQWARAFRALASSSVDHWPVTLIGGLIIAGLLSIRRGLRARLRLVAEPVGNVRRDNFWLTLRALVITLLLTLPGILIFVLAGYLMHNAEDASDFTQAVAAAVLQLAVLGLFIEPFAQVCRRHGLAECHFHWPDDARAGLHRMLRWLLGMLIVPTVLITLPEALDDDSKRQTIGRAAFIASCVFIAGFSWRLLHPQRGALANVMGSNERDYWRLGYLWLPLAVGVPLMLGAIVAWGYYYTALQMQSRFFYSAGLLGGCVILFSLIVRWLTIAERRLALTRALRKREEAREARATREAAAAAGEITPENLDTLEIDLVQITEQTRGLIKVVITLLVAGGLWLVWSDTLPALQLLDNVTLWQYTTEIEGQSHLTNVTLGSLLLALAVGVLTALAGRNLPGFLEITILRRFSLDPGSRYAMATLFQYAIVIAGLLVAVGIIGLRWSSIQWLVAALGVGLGFGLQEIFANFVSGIVILFERPVRVGDTVTIGTLTGTVSRIRIRATTITDWDNKEVVIPNKTFITETVINWTLTDDITRLIIRVGVAYDSDEDLVEHLIMEAIKAEPVALSVPAPSVFMVGYGDSALLYEARVFYHDLYNLLPLQHALYRRIHQAFNEHGVEIVFPQQDLHIRSVDDSVKQKFADSRSASPRGGAGYRQRPRDAGQDSASTDAGGPEGDG